MAFRPGMSEVQSGYEPNFPEDAPTIVSSRIEPTSHKAEKWIPFPKEENTLVRMESYNKEGKNYTPDEVITQGLIIAGKNPVYAKAVGKLLAASLNISEIRRGIEGAFDPYLEGTAGQWCDYIRDTTKKALEKGEVHQSLGGASGVYQIEIAFAQESGIKLKSETDQEGHDLNRVLDAIRGGIHGQIRREMHGALVSLKKFAELRKSEDLTYSDEDWLNDWLNWLGANGHEHDIYVGLSAETGDYSTHNHEQIVGNPILCRDMRTESTTQPASTEEGHPLFDIVLIDDDAPMSKVIESQNFEDLTEKSMSGRVLLAVNKETNTVTGIKFDFAHFAHDEGEARKYVTAILDNLTVGLKEELSVELKSDYYEKPRALVYRENKVEGRVAELSCGYTLTQEEYRLIRYARKSAGQMGIASFAALVSSQENLWSTEPANEGINGYICVAPEDDMGFRLQMALTFTEKLGMELGEITDEFLATIENNSETDPKLAALTLWVSLQTARKAEEIIQPFNNTKEWSEYVAQQIEMAKQGMCYPWVLRNRITDIEQEFLRIAMNEAYQAVSEAKFQISSVQWDKPLGVFTTAESTSIDHGISIASYKSGLLGDPEVTVTIRERYKEADIVKLEKDANKSREVDPDKVLGQLSDDIKSVTKTWRQKAVMTALVLGVGSTKEDTPEYEYFNKGNPPQAYIDAIESLRKV